MVRATPNSRAWCRICTRRRQRKWARKQRKRRLEERRRRIAGRRRLPARVRAWTAGIFEGEGTISILSGGRRGWPRPIVSVVSTDRQVIDFFQARWPGQIYSYTPKTPNGAAREARRWYLQSNDACEGFLLDIRPYLETRRVRAKADLLLKEIRDRVRYERSDAAKQRSWSRLRKIRVLNRRGVRRGRLGAGRDAGASKVAVIGARRTSAHSPKSDMMVQFWNAQE